MDHRVRLLTAALVIAVGLGLAMFFGRPTAETNLVIPGQSERTVFVKQPDSQPPGVANSPAETLPLHPQPKGALVGDAGETGRLSPTIVTPADRPTPPPELPKHYPDNGQPVSTRWGTSLRDMLPETASAPPTHKVIDGDSLAMLAERYLGSASRALEIYEANRDVLAHPAVLPIGAELKIPRAERASR